MKLFMCHWRRTSNEWEVIPLVSVSSNKVLSEVYEGHAYPDGLLYDTTIEAEDAELARLKFKQLLIDYLDVTVREYNRIMIDLREKLVEDKGKVWLGDELFKSETLFSETPVIEIDWENDLTLDDEI